MDEVRKPINSVCYTHHCQNPIESTQVPLLLYRLALRPLFALFSRQIEACEGDCTSKMNAGTNLKRKVLDVREAMTQSS
jgi:hypothetical protein